MANKRKPSSRGASFLRVFDGDFSKYMTIPSGFIKNFNGDLPQWFLLEIAGSRKCWRVDSEEDGNGGLYLSYGWNEFAKEQSLHVGDFLLFEYEEPFVLQVRIFEKDGAEKSVGTNLELEYEAEASECKRKNPKIKHQAEADICSTKPYQWGGHEKQQESVDMKHAETADQCGTHEKQQSSDWIDMETAYRNWIHEKELEVNNKTEQKTVDQCATHMKLQDYIEQIKMATANQFGVHESQHEVQDTTALEIDDQCRVHEKQENIERAGKVYVTEQGVCFTIIWRNAHHMYYYLTIPRAVLTGRMLSSYDTVILKDQEGRTWPIKIIERTDGRVDLTEGWRVFLIENDVRAGDILTFEFVSDNVIQIHVERAPLLGHPSERATKAGAVGPSGMTDYKGLGAKCKSNHIVPHTTGTTEGVFSDFASLSFSTTWKPHSSRSYLHIPKAIAKKVNLENKDTVVLCDPEGTQWPVQVRTRQSDGRFGLGQGWNAFWRKHKIADGDTLIFEFVSSRMMKVNTIRALLAHTGFSVGPAIKQEVTLLE